MDYFVVGTVPSKIDFNKDSYGLYLLGELGEAEGVGFNSGIQGYKKGMLSVGAVIEIFVIKDGSPLWLARARQVSVFSFQNENMLKRGATKKAIATLKECLDLAQAYCYANFSYEGKKHKFPMMPSIVQPYSQTEKGILDFLAANNGLKK